MKSQNKNFVQDQDQTQVATFGAGCFWGIEEVFRKLEGVVETQVGYCGGNIPDPSYESVCTGNTGHAEVVQIKFDEQKVSYQRLLEIFWANHNPTMLNRQGPDVGTQYRSVVFYHNQDQQKHAEQTKAQLQNKGIFSKPIVTEVTAASTFYLAEEYHQKYLFRKGLSSCSV